MRTSLYALVALGLGLPVTLPPPPPFVLTPDDAWAASPGADGTAASPALAGGSGALAPAEDPVVKDPTSPFRQKVICGRIDRPPGDWYEKSTNFITVAAAIGSRRWIRQVVFWCEGNSLTVTAPSINPETGTFGYVCPIASHPRRNGTAWFACYVQPWEGFERRTVEAVELNSIPAAPGYTDRRVDTGNGTPGAFARFLDPVNGSDANSGLSGAPWKTLLKAHAAAPDGGCIYVEPNATCIEDRFLYAENTTTDANGATVTSPRCNTRRIDTRCRVPGQSWHLTRTFRAFTLARSLISVDASGNFTVNQSAMPYGSSAGLALGWPILNPATGEKHYITAVSGYSGTLASAFTGTLDQPFATPLANAPFGIGYTSSGAAAHIFSARHLGMFDCAVDQARMPSPQAPSVASPANTLLAPAATGALPGTYTMGGRIWWENCQIVDPYGNSGPMLNYQSPGYPAPAPAGEFSYGTGYWDPGTADPEALTNYISFIGRNVSATTPANDPYDQTVGFSGFGECTIDCRAIAGDVLRRNVRGRICHDLNYFNQNNIAQFNNDIIQNNNTYYRMHREPVLTVCGTPSFDGSNTTITVYGQPSFKPGLTAAAVGQQPYQDVHFLTGTLAPGQLAWNSFRPGTDTVTGGMPNVRTGDLRLVSLAGGVPLGTTAPTPANTSQVVVCGDATAARDGDTFAVFCAEHPDVAQFGNQPGAASAAADQGAPGQNNYLFQHNRYQGYDVQWVFESNQQTIQNAGNLAKLLPVPGGCTLSADGGDTTVTFSSAVALNVGDIIVAAPQGGTVTQPIATTDTTLTTSFAPVVGATISFVANGATFTRYVTAVSGSGPYTVTLDAVAGVYNNAPAGGSCMSTPVAAVVAVAPDGLSATLSQTFPALSGASFTREIGVSTSGTTARFSSSITGLMAADDSVIVKSGPQIQAYARVLAIGADGLSATLSKPMIAPTSLAPADQGWVRWIQGKGTRDVAWIGNHIELLFDLSGLENAMVEPPRVATPTPLTPAAGQFQSSPTHWVYAQNTICTHSPTSPLVLRIAVDCAVEDVHLFDNVLPSIGGELVTYFGRRTVQSPPYQGLVSDNNHWLVNLGSGGSVLTATTMGVPPVEPTATIGPVSFDDVGPATGTYRPKLGGGLSRAPLGNTTTGGLLLPCSINPVTGQLTVLPNPASTYLVGAQPVGL